MDFTRYVHHTVQDFLDDDYFIQWVVNPSKDNDRYWNVFIKEYPSQETTVHDAARIIRAYRMQSAFLNESGEDTVWKKIEDTIENHSLGPKIISIAFVVRIAAVIILICSIGVYWYYTSNSPKQIITRYGHIQKVVLPDQSVVILNGNSEISFSKEWKSGQPREVWLKGEALFEVKHINRDTLNIRPYENFIVHSNKLNIEVLGTTFNVRNRRNRVNVSLISGKVKISEASGNGSLNKGLVMHTGDVIDYRSRKEVLKKKTENPEKVARWTNRRLFFSNTTLGEIAASLEDSYGYKVTFSTSDLPALKIGGEIDVASVHELLETISTSLHVKVLTKEQSIYIH